MIEVYGASDDLVEIEGDISEEISACEPVLLAFSDGTILHAGYGKKPNLGIWEINVLREGERFGERVVCIDEDAERYSDTVFMNGGVEWVWVGNEPQRIRAKGDGKP